MTPQRNTKQIHIGTCELSLCIGATSRAATLPPNGFRDVGNVDTYQHVIENDFYEREGSYRGKKAVDAKFSIKQKLGYTCKCDEATYENLKLALMGQDLGDNVRDALAEDAADLVPFTTDTPSDSRLWYDLTVDGEKVPDLAAAVVFGGTPLAATTAATGDTFTDAAHGLANGDRAMLVTLVTTTGATILTPYFVVNATTDTFKLATTAGGAALDLASDGSATYLAGLKEDIDCGFDGMLGRLRFMTQQSHDVYCFLTAEEITSASTNYRRSMTPLEVPSVEGYARLAMFSAEDETLKWEHRDFSVSITVQNFGESNGKAPATFDIMLTVTADRGVYFAPDEDLS